MPNVEPGEIPFRLSIEGTIQADKVPELVAAIAEVAVGVQVIVETLPVNPPEEVPTQIIAKDDFQKVWNMGGAGSAWGVATRLAYEEDFPLNLRETKRGHLLEGNIQEALTWLRLNRPSRGAGSGVLLNILEKIITAAEATDSAHPGE